MCGVCDGPLFLQRIAMGRENGWKRNYGLERCGCVGCAVLAVILQILLSYALYAIKRMHTTGTMIEQSCHVSTSNITLSSCNSRKRGEGQVQDANELLCLGTMRLEQSRIVYNTPGHRFVRSNHQWDMEFIPAGHSHSTKEHKDLSI